MKDRMMRRKHERRKGQGRNQRWQPWKRAPSVLVAPMVLHPPGRRRHLRRWAPWKPLTGGSGCKPR